LQQYFSVEVDQVDDGPRILKLVVGVHEIREVDRCLEPTKVLKGGACDAQGEAFRCSCSREGAGRSPGIC